MDHLPVIVRVPPSSVTSYFGSGSSAGPESTSPVVTEKFVEWHGQMMASSVTLLTWQPWCVHTDENAKNSPFFG
ncbi:hypothetical protein EB836_04225 [Brevibacterium sp. S111]|nr:hypothetical protein EB836_04225 [Brevibacterium sp. S111]